MSRMIVAIVCLSIIITYTSCDRGERTVLTPAEKELLDSLYSKSVPYYRKQADSICDATYQEVFDRAADSIKQVYIQEIKEILEGGG